MHLLLMALPLMMASCSDNNLDNPATVPTEVIAPVVNTKADLTLDITTDKAVYKPGETVRFSIDGTLPSSAHVRYRHGATVIADEPLSATSWTWTPPHDDYTGYLADIYTTAGTNQETLYATIGVDVSSDWGRFPRYGFIASYGSDKTSEVIASEMAMLNRCHINGLQFYDWQYKQHWPLGGTPGALLDSYKDIANRDNYTSVVKDYIDQAHSLGMKAMFYDLCFGAFDDAKTDGVDDRWYMYTDRNHSEKDCVRLPSGWKSDIYLVDPSNTGWQTYFADRVDDVYTAIPFDGFHIDQLGKRNTLYDYYGSQINLPNGYASFVKAMKERQPDKRLVMNAVSNYGADKIVSTGCMDFMYTEMWGSEDKFVDLYNVIKANTRSSGGKLKQVYAAYMNYNHQQPKFNVPGVLLTDAVMFALGASHLELGDDHMLCSEYFPNSDVKMSEDLKKHIVSYYDFLTAYQNLLRDGGTEIVSDLATSKTDVRINSWPPVLGAVTTFSKWVDNTQVVHLLNFRQANSLSWRDIDGTMPEPDAIENLTLRLHAKNVKKLWVASPDYLGGAAQELQYRQEGDDVVFTVPQLKYWTMIVAE